MLFPAPPARPSPTGQRFFLIRSDRSGDRFYVVGWNEERIGWQCTCGAGCKSHSHVKKASKKAQEHAANMKQSEREQALAVARAASEAALAQIDAEVIEQIETEQSAPQQPRSEMARIADLDESNEEAKIERWTDEELLPGAGWLARHEQGERKQRELSQRNKEQFNAELARIKAEQANQVA